jgi:RNA polymerase sigma factor (sigma-70 family)
MMAVMDDRALLEDYRTRRSQSAFTQLAERHVPLVYSTALRITGQPAMAEDIAQAVFISLARRAAFVRDPAALPGWLYQTTCHIAYNTLRAEKRRRGHETAAMQISDLFNDSRSAWEHLAPLLDEAMARLSAADQNIVVQRFFEGRSLREVGEKLGLSDDAAQKRVHRAVEKLREYFVKNGVVVPAAVLAPVLAEHAIHSAPAHLAPKISTAVYATSGAGGSVLFKLLILMSEIKIKTGLTAAALAVLLGTLGWSAWVNFQGSRDASAKPFAPTPPPAFAGQTAAAFSPAASMSIVRPAVSSSSKNSQNTFPALPGSASVIDKMADRTVLANHAAYGKNMAIAFIQYANKNNGELPRDISAVRDLLGDNADNFSFKIIFHGSINQVKKPAQTVLLREEPFMLSQGLLARCYVYVDGHVESATSATGDFSAWENEHTDNLTNP